MSVGDGVGVAIGVGGTRVENGVGVTMGGPGVGGAGVVVGSGC